MTHTDATGCIEVHLRALDTTVVVELAGSGAGDLEPIIRRAWSRCVTAPSGEDVRVRVDHETGADVRPLMDRLSPRVTLAAIEHQMGNLMMLHAAGLADPVTGRTVGLVASSGTGKTTACRRLAREWGYVTDETLAVRSDGSVASYPKPLSLVTDDAFKDQVAVDELAMAPDRCELAGLVVLKRDGSETLDVETLSTARGIGALAPESSALARIPRPLHRLAEIVEQVGGVHVARYRDAEQLSPLISELVGAS